MEILDSFWHKAKSLELYRCLVPHLGGLKIISSDRSSIFNAWIEYILRKHRLSLATTGDGSSCSQMFFKSDDFKNSTTFLRK